MTRRRIAILGGGMLGACTALELARRGHAVSLVEGDSKVLNGASRWNEGKIHLGFLYAADSSLRTAKRLIPGGLAFRSLVESLLGCDLRQFMTEDEVFLVHRDSVVDAAAFEQYARQTAALVHEAASADATARYLTDVRDSAVRLLTSSELADVTASGDVVAGFRFPERSVSTVAIADLLSASLLNEARIEVQTGTWVTGVRRREDGRLDVLTSTAHSHIDGGFDFVVNALWEGRPAVDATLGIQPPGPWSHRFRAAVFAYAPQSALGTAVLCTGPFGDIKRYADGRVYLSWYRAGLLAEGNEIEPPRATAALTERRRVEVLRGTLTGLASFFPKVGGLGNDGATPEVHGGWVYAVGQGALDDRSSTIHRRDRFNMTIDRGYISVDTAKYSLAPFLARRVAELISSA